MTQSRHADQGTLDWLLAGDPAIRWQVERDLFGLPVQQYTRTRALVAQEGWGAEILRRYDPELQWGYEHPRIYHETADGSALMMLQLLTQLGALPDDPRVAAVVDQVGTSVRFPSGGRTFFQGETEACINGRVLSIDLYFGRDMGGLKDQLLGEQLADGDWNCFAPDSSRFSVHSIICVLEGLLNHCSAAGDEPRLRQAVRRAMQYPDDRRLMYRMSDGQLMKSEFTQLCFPFFYGYDILRMLDLLHQFGFPPLPAHREALDIIRAKRGENGRWKLDRQDEEPERMLTRLETVGGDSRWITLMALRVLDWAEAA